MELYTIYKITNKVNNKCYIGFTQNIEKRWRSHKSKNGSKNKLLYKSFTKYGIDNFSFEIIYQSKLREHTLTIMEPFFIKTYESYGPKGYNMNEGGSNTNDLDKKHKSKIRMKLNNPMKTLRTNSGSFKKGHIPLITDERNKKISLSKKGEKNPNYGKTETSNHINIKKTCLKCGKTTTLGNLARWHKH